MEWIIPGVLALIALVILDRVFPSENFNDLKDDE